MTIYPFHKTSRSPTDSEVGIVPQSAQRNTVEAEKDVATRPAQTPAPSPPPNGGLVAWLQVVGSFFLWFTTWGITLSFGVFQTYYQENYLSDLDPSDIAWIGTIQAFFLFFVTLLSGPMFDRGHLRLLLVIGTLFLVVGIMTTSVAQKFYSIILSLGVCTGIGMGCLFAPSIAIIGTYFTSRRAIASGLSAAGGGVGGVIIPIIFRPLITAVGFGWAVRIIAFIMLALLIVAFVLLKQRPSSNKPRKLLDLSAFRQPEYSLFCVAVFFIFVGAYTPFYYLSIFAEEKLGASQSLSFDILAVLGAGSTIGRILPNIAAAKYGAFNVLCFCVLVCGLLQFIWGSVHSIGGLSAFAAFYGIFSGVTAGLPPVIIAQISPSLDIIGTRIGMALQFGALGFLIGNPIAGAILSGKAGFEGVQAFSGAILLSAFVVLFLASRAYENRRRATA